MPKTDPERVPLTSADPESAASDAQRATALFPLSPARARIISALALAAVVVISVAAVAREGSVHPARLGSARPAWPMTRVLVRPDHGDALEEVKEHWNQHHKGGADDLIPLHLPDLRAWPDAGGYRELVGLIAGAGLRAHRVRVPQVRRGRAEDPSGDREGFDEFASSALGHLAGWLEARKRHARMLIMNDYETTPGAFMGPPRGFRRVRHVLRRQGPQTLGRALPG